MNEEIFSEDTIDIPDADIEIGRASCRERV